MNSHTEPRFWRYYHRLPVDVQRQADVAYAVWKVDPYHPSLQFKCVDSQASIYSARVGRGYRALGWRHRDTVIWFWIGDHDEYDRILR